MTDERDKVADAIAFCVEYDRKYHMVKPPECKWCGAKGVELDEDGYCSGECALLGALENEKLIEADHEYRRRIGD